MLFLSLGSKADFWEGMLCIQFLMLYYGKLSGRFGALESGKLTLEGVGFGSWKLEVGRCFEFLGHDGGGGEPKPELKLH
jgi:hypothetical protein